MWGINSIPSIKSKGYLTLLIALLALSQWALCPLRLSAQTYLIPTKSSHGSLFLGDNEQYSYQVLDKEFTRVTYQTFLSFEDSDEEGVEDVFILQIGGKSSKFSSKIHYQMDSIKINAKGDFSFGSINGLHRINPVFFYECYYTDLSTRELTFTNRLTQEDFKYNDAIPEIKWSVDYDSTMVICGFECHKAIGVFRGRTYEAWFTESIPSTAGPWKLGGLPGAILLAEDTDHKCRFEAQSVEIRNDDILMAEYPYTKVSRKQYARLLQMRILKPTTFNVAHGNKNPNMKMTASGPDEPQRMITILESE
ncbi:MAG: GLPGLI family protein [Bacteroidales bacterium]|nr:GLPGLI family protein [Bacteroidales bacterium]